MDEQDISTFAPSPEATMPQPWACDLNDANPQLPEKEPLPLKQIKQELARRARDWVPRHFPNARCSKDGKEWRLANTSGDAPHGDGSCSIDCDGEYAGCIRDWSTGEHGDQFETLRYATGLTGRDLYEYAADLVGDLPSAKTNGHDHSRATEESKARRAQYTAREVALIRQHCVPARGTLAETYLQSRGLDLPDCPDLLYHDDLLDWKARRGRPGLVFVIRHSESREETGGIWRIYLSDDGSAKADTPEPKMGLGPATGGVVMLAPMGEDGVLGIAEGVETALAAMKLFDIPVWSALSTSGFISPVFPPGLRQLTIFADRGSGAAKGPHGVCIGVPLRRVSRRSWCCRSRTTISTRI